MPAFKERFHAAFESCMHTMVWPLLKNSEVFRGIVGRVTVDMMNYLFFSQESAEYPLHNQSMLWDKVLSCMRVVGSIGKNVAALGSPLVLSAPAPFRIAWARQSRILALLPTDRAMLRMLTCIRSISKHLLTTMGTLRPDQILPLDSPLPAESSEVRLSRQVSRLRIFTSRRAFHQRLCYHT